MKYLKSFNESNSFLTDEEEIKETLSRIALVGMFRILNNGILDRAFIHPDGTVDIGKGSIIITMSQNETRLPIKFGEVEEIFTFAANPISGLTTLEGFPRKAKVVNLSGLSKNVWDARPLRGCSYRVIVDSPERPICELMNLFNEHGTHVNNLDTNSREEISKRFLHSLDYNYIRSIPGGSEGEVCINLFRLKEALSEFDITDPFTANPHYYRDNRLSRTLNHYQLVDELGRRVNFDGEFI